MEQDVVFMVCIGVTAVVACHKAKSKIKEVKLPQDTFLSSKEAQGNVSFSVLPFCMYEILMTVTCRGNKQNWVGQHVFKSCQKPTLDPGYLKM